MKINRPTLTHVCILLALTALAVGTARAAEPSPERQGELVRLVRQDCGSCHGLTFNGGLGPALTSEALWGKPAEALVATVMQGRPGTAMPGWQRFLNEQEATWVINRLLQGFPSLATR